MALLKRKKQAETEPKKKGKGKRILKGLLMLIVLLVLIVGGFALGIYLRIFDTQQANEKLGLYNLPIIGQYFVKPAPTTSDMSNEPVEDVKPTADPDKDKQQKKVTLSKKEIEKQMQERQKEERKRVSKLARLYGGMKPADAAADMDALDDDLCVAILQRMEERQASKVLAQFEPSKAARLTQLIYQGTQRSATTAADLQGQDQTQGQTQTQGN